MRALHRWGLLLVLGSAPLWSQGWGRVSGRLEAATPIALVQSTRTGRLWVSTGEALYTTPTIGTGWSLVTTLPFSTSTLALAADGAAEALLACTPYGLWRSTDDGATWAQVHPPLGSTARLRVHPSYPNVVLGLRGQSLWRSTDAGATWESVTAPPGVLYDACPFGALSDLVAWTNQGMFRSTDGGSSWEPVSADLPTQPVVSLAVTTGAEPSICLALPAGVYRSTDGITWMQTTVSGALPRALFAAGSNLAAVAPGALLVLRGGTTWESVYTGYTDHVTVLLPVGSDRMLVGSALRGLELYRWVPQPQWQPLRTGMDAPSILWLARTGTGLVVGGPSGIFWSDSDIAGLDNITLSLPQPAPITGFALHRGGVTVATAAGLFRYQRSTGQWQPLGTEPPVVGALHALGVSPSGDTLVALSEFGELVRSTDAGASWQLPDFPYRCTAVAAFGSLFYAFGDDGLFRSSDAGATWEPVAGYPARACYLLVAHPANSALLLASSTLPGTRTGALYRSTDGGRQWSALPVPELLARGIATLAAGEDSQTWYAGTIEGEVFRSSDGGTSWHSLGTIGNGLPVQALLELGPTLLAGTQRGLWQQQLVSVPTEVVHPPLIGYSNGIVELRIPEAAPVQVRLYDVRGGLVATWDITESSGYLRLPLPPCAPGLYVLRLRTQRGWHSAWFLAP